MEVPATVLELHAVTAAMAVITREDGLVLASKRLIDDVYVKLADLGCMVFVPWCWQIGYYR